MAATVPIWFGSIGLSFDKRTGTLTLAERNTYQDIYNGPYSVCFASVVARGVFGGGARLGFVCTSSVAEQVDRGNIGKLTINWEAGGVFATLPLPVDEFDVQPQEVYPRIERSPQFAGLTPQTLALAYQVINGATPQARAEAQMRIDGLAPTGAGTQHDLGQELYGLLKLGQETFYRGYARYVWSSYYYIQPTLNLGGVISSPGGPLAAQLATAQCLRLADALSPAGVNGSMYKLTRTWICVPAADGFWNTTVAG